MGFSRMELTTTIKERHMALGAGLLALGIILLVGLRFWASPVARRITGTEPPGAIDFIGIPVFLVVAGLGLFLFLWEPNHS